VPPGHDFRAIRAADEWLRRLEDFLDRYLLPCNAAWHAVRERGERRLRRRPAGTGARRGLWNLCLPALPAGAPGTALSHLDYAPLAEAMGRLPWAPEVFNCNAPDSGNMELLLRHADAAQKRDWLVPLLAGDMRAAFAMSEPDVASSDPTNLQTEARMEGGELVISGRKWFITGAAHPDCRLLIVVCRNAGAGDADRHHAHSLVLVPMDAPGVEVVRNIPVLHHRAPEGHCEIVLRGVRVPQANLLGGWGDGFALAQSRLVPDACTTACAPSGQCELALALACDRALERRAFGKPLAQQANVQEWIADSRIEIDQARLLVLRTAWALDQDAPPADLREQIAAIKVVAARLQTRVVDRAIQVFGAMGLSPDTPLAGCGPGAGRCASWTGRTRCTCAPSPAANSTRRRAARPLGRLLHDPEQLAAPPRIASGHWRRPTGGAGGCGILVRAPPGRAVPSSTPLRFCMGTHALIDLWLRQARDQAVVVLDPQGVVSEWLGAAELLLGFEAQEAVGRHIALIFTDEDRAGGYPDHELRVAAEDAYSEDSRWHVRKDGTRIWFGDGQRGARPEGRCWASSRSCAT
jgi:acyl-CoA dehydrogenase